MKEERASRLCWAALLAITVLSAWARSPALNPEALWYDDAWVAVISRIESWNDFYGVGRSSPVGFTFVCYLSAQLFSDLEIGMQAFPFALGLLQIPLFALLVWHLSRSRTLAVLGGALLAVSPQLVLFSTRVKQYSTDSFTTILLVLLFSKIIENSTKLSLRYQFIAASIGCSLFSHTACFVSFLLIGLWLIKELCDSQFALKHFASKVWMGCIYYLFVGGYYVIVLKGQSQPHLKNYWRNEFLPLDEGLFRFLEKKFLLKFILHAFPESHTFPSWWLILALAPLILLGGHFLFLSRRQSIPWLNVMLILFYIQALVLSALKIYPLGGNRIDIYSHPIHILLVVLGIGFVLKVKDSGQGRRIVVVFTCFILIIGMPGWAQPEQTYINKKDSKALMGYVEARLGEDDGLILHLMDHDIFALYSSLPVRVRAEGNNRKITIERKFTYSLIRWKDDSETYRLNSGTINKALEQEHQRVYLFSSQQANNPTDELVREAFRKAGYIVRAFEGYDQSQITVFTRESL